MKPTREEVLEKAVKEIAADICDNKYTKIARAAITDSVHLAEPTETSTDTSLESERERFQRWAHQFAIHGQQPDAWDAWQAALQSASQGRAIVPVEPTWKMVEAGRSRILHKEYVGNVDMMLAYGAMIEVAQSGISSPDGRPNEQNAVQTEQPSLSNHQLNYVQECIERAKLLPVWDNVPHSLHAELDNIFRGVALLSAQRQDSNKDAERYRLVRSISQMSVKQQNAIAEAMNILPDDESKPTIEQFDAVVDAGIAYIANGAPK